MAATRYLPGSAALLLVSLLGALPAAAAPPLEDRPVIWQEDDRRNIEMPEERDPSLLRDGIDESLFNPLGRLLDPRRLMRRAGTPFGGDPVWAASNVNSLDEVPHSAWFTNRIGLRAMSLEEIARGPARNDGPDMSRPLTVVKAKTEGVTPGFNVKDVRGDTYLLKFDPPCCPDMTSAADVISGRILYACGFNVPADFVVRFRREDLVLGPTVQIAEPGGAKRPMTAADLDEILSRVSPGPDGRWRAVASQYLTGKPVGPFCWRGRRKDDPNDRVNHENRRELRGLRVIAAWIGHFDTKQQNTLDTYVEEGGRHYLRHHLIDFASTLGAGATGPFPESNFEYALDVPASLGRALSLGIHQDAWRRVRRPAGLDAVGFFESKEFDPIEWKPLDPNSAFANLTDRDGYWAAKIVSAFTNPQIEAIVAEGRYRDAAASAWIARTLEARRDKVARYWFDRVAPLDYFSLEGSMLRFHDLASERGLEPAGGARYRTRIASVDASREGAEWTSWSESEEPSFDLSGAWAADATRAAGGKERPFLAVECQVSRGGRLSPPVTVYIAHASRRIIAMER
jgi:hypothetical protein